MECSAFTRIIQVNLFERKLLRSRFVPDKKWRKHEEPQLISSCYIKKEAFASFSYTKT
jgi:hypothetical protein